MNTNNMNDYDNSFNILYLLFSEELFPITSRINITILSHTRIMCTVVNINGTYVLLPRRLSCKLCICINIDQPSCLVMHGEVAQGPSKLLHSAVLQATRVPDLPGTPSPSTLLLPSPKRKHKLSDRSLKVNYCCLLFLLLKLFHLLQCLFFFIFICPISLFYGLKYSGE